MKKYIPYIAVIAVVIAVVLITTAGNEKGQEQQVTIGFISALTGDAASWGEGALRGAQIAIDEFQAKGRLKGTIVSLEVTDDKCDAKEGVTALQQLLLKNPDVIVGTVCSSPTIAMLPITEAQKKVFVSAGASSPKLTEMGDYFFRVYPSDSFSASTIAQFAIEQKSLKRFATLTLQNDYGEGLKKVFTETVEQNGGTVVTAEKFLLNASDFKTQISKIKQANPEAMFIGSNPKEFPLIVKQVRELGFPGVLLTDVVAESDEAKKTWTDVEELYFATPKEPATDVWQRLKETHQAKYGKEADLLVQLGYDSVMVVMEAMKKGGTDSRKMKDFLYGLKDYPGASGMLTFDRNGDVQKPFQVKKIVNGTSETVSQ